jgi:hypothetical protein
MDKTWWRTWERRYPQVDENMYMFSRMGASGKVGSGYEGHVK